MKRWIKRLINWLNNNSCYKCEHRGGITYDGKSHHCKKHKLRANLYSTCADWKQWKAKKGKKI